MYKNTKYGEIKIKVIKITDIKLYKYHINNNYKINI